jgi:uncharacterized protein YodC (DUF2158 family)
VIKSKGEFMANKFSKGDVVVLKSGGVPMTIKQTPGDKFRGDTLPDGLYFCIWQKGATHMEHPYDEHVLEKFVSPAKK